MSTSRMETRIGNTRGDSANSTSNTGKFQGSITKWEKKWVSLGHLKLLKWVPVRPRRHNGVHPYSQEKDRKHAINRPFNDNAPITRSISSSNKAVKAALITPPQPVKIRRNPEREARATLPIVEPDEMDDMSPPASPVTPPPPHSMSSSSSVSYFKTPATPATPTPATPATPASPSASLDDRNDEDEN